MSAAAEPGKAAAAGGCAETPADPGPPVSWDVPVDIVLAVADQITSENCPFFDESDIASVAANCMCVGHPLFTQIGEIIYQFLSPRFGEDPGVNEDSSVGELKVVLKSWGRPCTGKKSELWSRIQDEVVGDGPAAGFTASAAATAAAAAARSAAARAAAEAAAAGPSTSNAAAAKPGRKRGSDSSGAAPAAKKPSKTPAAVGGGGGAKKGKGSPAKAAAGDQQDDERRQSPPQGPPPALPPPDAEAEANSGDDDLESSSESDEEMESDYEEEAGRSRRRRRRHGGGRGGRRSSSKSGGGSAGKGKGKGKSTAAAGGRGRGAAAASDAAAAAEQLDVAAKAAEAAAEAEAVPHCRCPIARGPKRRIIELQNARVTKNKAKEVYGLTASLLAALPTRLVYTHAFGGGHSDMYALKDVKRLARSRYKSYREFYATLQRCKQASREFSNAYNNTKSERQAMVKDILLRRGVDTDEADAAIKHIWYLDFFTAGVQYGGAQQAMEPGWLPTNSEAAANEAHTYLFHVKNTNWRGHLMRLQATHDYSKSSKYRQDVALEKRSFTMALQEWVTGRTLADLTADPRLPPHLRPAAEQALRAVADGSAERERERLRAAYTAKLAAGMGGGGGMAFLMYGHEFDQDH
ncbi:hypothetical protein HYH02_000768 [Chlamydomonas schloesseri]|uniref:SAP domain-containing protein n=1 Tax=Chlamydomonas schloesseri TaxID=2026947 RepID=A0A836BDS8_9CHLO|nr:hypothetical protein HYH02_000768 [Chlamydomonas schloesseri]|eukprot:KAG2454940.1 hypothetical protein HYH02_000768 [Chlamydomonas schloesseri]